MDVRTSLIVSALCLLASGSVIPEVQRPEYLKLCSRSDPKIDACLKQRFQNLLPHLVKGEPEIDLPSLEKVRLDDVKFNKEVSADVGAGVILRLGVLRGLETVQVQNVRSDVTDSRVKMSVDLRFPHVQFEGYFRTNLDLNRVTLINEGSFNVSLVQVTGTMVVTGKTYEKEGRKYLQIQHMRLSPSVGQATVMARNLGEGTPNVVEVVTAIVNKYWGALFSEYVPYIEEKWDLAMTGLANKVISNVPFDHLFPNV